MKYREVAFHCTACGSDIYEGEKCLTDNSGEAYHLDKKCLTDAMKRNLELLDELEMVAILERCCDGTIEEAAW